MYGVSVVRCFYAKGKDTVYRVRCVEPFLIAGLVVSGFCVSVSAFRVDCQMKLFLSSLVDRTFCS